MFQLDLKLQFRETRALKYEETVGYASRTFIELEKWYAVRTLPSLGISAFFSPNAKLSGVRQQVLA